MLYTQKEREEIDKKIKKSCQEILDLLNTGIANTVMALANATGDTFGKVDEDLSALKKEFYEFKALKESKVKNKVKKNLKTKKNAKKNNRNKNN